MARITDDRLKKDFQADLLEYWRIVVKRRWAIFSVVTVFVVLALVYSLTATPVYKAISNILIEEPGSNVLHALAAAGGLSDYADSDKVFVVRKSLPQRVRFRYADLRSQDPKSIAFTLQAGDVVVVE